MSKYRIQKLKKTLTLDFAANSTVITATQLQLNGVLVSSTIKTPAAVDTSATVGIKLTDSDGVDVFTRTGAAVNTNVNTLLADATRVPLSGTYTLTVTFSAAQTANRATDVTLYIDRGN